MCDAFSQVYSLPAQIIQLSAEDTLHIRQTAADFMDPDWLYGTTPPFSFSCEGHFSWGNMQLQLQVRKDAVAAVKVYTDAMDWAIAEAVENALIGCRFEIDALCRALKSSALGDTVSSDLCILLRAQQL